MRLVMGRAVLNAEEPGKVTWISRIYIEKGER